MERKLEMGQLIAGLGLNSRTTSQSLKKESTGHCYWELNYSVTTLVAVPEGTGKRLHFTFCAYIFLKYINSGNRIQIPNPSCKQAWGKNIPIFKICFAVVSVFSVQIFLSGRYTKGEDSCWSSHSIISITNSLFIVYL